ncbi:MAG: carbohydrate ABC transporter permease [Candidatus Methanomethylicaceae archaeon]
MSVIGISMVLPFIWMIFSSFKTGGEIYVFPPTFIPEKPTLEGYYLIFRIVDVPRVFLNTFIYAISVSLGTIFISSLAAFSFSFLKFHGQHILYSTIISVMFIPFFVYVIPLYIILIRFGLVNTYHGLIIPQLTSPFAIFLIAQYMKTMRLEYIDAARIDGAPYRTIYFRIVLPYCKPILSMLGVLTFVSTWTDFFWPLIALRSPDMLTLPVAIANISGQYIQYWNVMMAFTTIAIIPIITIFVTFRKWFLQSAAWIGIRR